MNVSPLQFRFSLFCALSALFLILVAGKASAQFEYELGQARDYIAPPTALQEQIPPEARVKTVHPMPAEEPRPLLDEVPGRPFYQVDPPPPSRAYWKYPFYLVLGLPRDLVDAFFGFFHKWPVVNVAVVGIPYEFVPTQYLIRDPRDWHRWGGGTNDRGHGWRPASRVLVRDAAGDWQQGQTPEEKRYGLLFDQSWGWFPSLNSWEFTYISERKNRKYKERNERLRAQLVELNREIDAHNREIAERKRHARARAVEAIDAGNGFEAVSWILPYHLAYPSDESAHAIFLNALAVYGDAGPDWVEPVLFRELATVNLSVLQQTETLLTESRSDFPESRSLNEALIFARTRLGDFDGALGVAQEFHFRRPDDPRRSRLLFETALAAGDEHLAERGLSAIKARESDPAAVQLMDLRMMLLRDEPGQARPQLAELAARNPERLDYHYYLGLAQLMSLDESETPDALIAAAVESLEKASLLARTPWQRDRVDRALGFARALAGEDQRPAEPERQTFFDISQ